VDFYGKKLDLLGRVEPALFSKVTLFSLSEVCSVGLKYAKNMDPLLVLGSQLF